jgi:hypothetical protein
MYKVGLLNTKEQEKTGAISDEENKYELDNDSDNHSSQDSDQEYINKKKENK